MKSFEITAILLSVALTSASSISSATVVYQQSFSANTATIATTMAQYGLSDNGLSFAEAQSGILRIGGVGGETHSADIGAFAGDLTIGYATTVVGGNGSGNTGFRIGDNYFVFHPGYPGGAFRIEGPNGHGNVDMGFTPVEPQMNFVSITVQASTGLTTLSMDDGNVLHFFREEFLNTNYRAGVTVLGLSVGGGVAASFDNVQITSSVPEPAGWALLVGGLLAAAVVARQRRG